MKGECKKIFLLHLLRLGLLNGNLTLLQERNVFDKRLHSLLLCKVPHERSRTISTLNTDVNTSGDMQVCGAFTHMTHDAFTQHVHVHVM